LISVKDYGATGDGRTDDTQAISRALCASVVAQVQLYFPAGRYVCGPIGIQGAPRICGDGPEETVIVQSDAATYSTPIWSFYGMVGEPVRLAQDARAGSHTIVLAGIYTHITRGALIVISSDALVDPLNASNEYIGQQVRVKRVTFEADKTFITTYEALTDDFNVGGDVSVCLVEPIRNCTIRDLSFDNPRPGATRAVALQISYAENVIIERVNATRLDNAAIVLRDVYQFRVSGCYWSNFNNDPKAERNPYGIVVQCASAHGVVSECRADRVRHLFTTDGAADRAGCPYNILVSNCVDSNSLNAAFDTHPAARGITFVGCISHGSNGPGLQARGQDVAFRDCTVDAARYGAVLMLPTKGCEIRDCRFTNIHIPPEATDSGSNDGGVGVLINHPASDLKIIGCVFINLQRSVVRFSSTSSGSENITICGNLVENPCLSNFPGDRDFVRGVRAPVVTNLLIACNRVVRNCAESVLRYLVATLGAGSSVRAEQNVVPESADPMLADPITLEQCSIQLETTRFGL
jgi:hypothetical protein